MRSTRNNILIIIAGGFAAMVPFILLSEIPKALSSLTGLESDEVGSEPAVAAFRSEPEVVASDNKLYVVWSEDQDGSKEIFFKRSPDNGQSFSKPINLSNTTGESFSPAIYVFKNFVKVSWIEEVQSLGNSKNSSLQRTSTDYGLIFGAPVDLDAAPPQTLFVNDARRSLVDDVYARAINSTQTLFFIKSGGVYEDGQLQPNLRLDIAIPSSASNDIPDENGHIRFQYFAYVNDGSTIGSQCSDIRVHMYVDGLSMGSSNWVGYEGGEAPIPLDTGIIESENISPSMQHTLTLIPEGRVSGCNVGWLNAWGGFIVLYK